MSVLECPFWNVLVERVGAASRLGSQDQVHAPSNAHAALPSDGAAVVYDAIIDDVRKEKAFGLLMSLNMLIEIPGGLDYTGRECIGWMQDAGFHDSITLSAQTGIR